jgi:hypothetical protein
MCYHNNEVFLLHQAFSDPGFEIWDGGKIRTHCPEWAFPYISDERN